MVRNGHLRVDCKSVLQYQKPSYAAIRCNTGARRARNSRSGRRTVVRFVWPALQGGVICHQSYNHFHHNANLGKSQARPSHSATSSAWPTPPAQTLAVTPTSSRPTGGIPAQAPQGLALLTGLLTCGAPLRRRSAPHPLRLCIWGAVIAPQPPPRRLSSFYRKGASRLALRVEGSPAAAATAPGSLGCAAEPGRMASLTRSACAPAAASACACGASSSAAGVSGGGVLSLGRCLVFSAVCFGGSRELPSCFGSFVGGVVGRVLGCPACLFAVGCAAGGDALALQSLAVRGAASRVSVFCAGDASGRASGASRLSPWCSPLWRLARPRSGSRAVRSRPRCGSGWRRVRAWRSCRAASRCRSRAGFCSRPCRVARSLRPGRRRSRASRSSSSVAGGILLCSLRCWRAVRGSRCSVARSSAASSGSRLALCCPRGPRSAVRRAAGCRGGFAAALGAPGARPAVFSCGALGPLGFGG